MSAGNKLMHKNRRIFLLAMLSALFGTARAQPGRSPADWLDEALTSMRDERAIAGVLSFTRFKDEFYVLNEPTRWEASSKRDSLPAVEVPRGFVTDLASVPRVFFSLFRPDGAYAHAAVIHDYLYWSQTTPRSVADEIFLKSMQDLRISPVQSRILFEAVSLFGQRSWEINKKLRESGERRILKVFPTKADTTWVEWKTRDDVFL